MYDMLHSTGTWTSLRLIGDHVPIPAPKDAAEKGAEHGSEQGAAVEFWQFEDLLDEGGTLSDFGLDQCAGGDAVSAGPLCRPEFRPPTPSKERRRCGG